MSTACVSVVSTSGGNQLSVSLTRYICYLPVFSPLFPQTGGPNGQPGVDQLDWWVWVAVGLGGLVVVLLMVFVIVMCKRIRRRKVSE